MTAIDRLYLNGRLWTGDAALPEAQALAVSGETIVAVGSTAQMRALAGSGVDSIDLEGRRVVPGFIDAHWHFIPNTAASLFMAGNLAELQRRLLTLADADPDGGWIIDSGWAYSDFPDNTPHRCSIDKVVSNRPVWLTGRDGHMVLLNSLALQALQIDAKSDTPASRSAVRDAQGELTGELRGMAAIEALRAQLPAPTAAQLDRLLRDVQAQAQAFGITSVHNLDEAQGDILACLQRAHHEGWLGLRVQQAHRLLPDPDAARLELLGSRRRSTAGNTLFSFSGLKGWLDGTIDARTAHMREALTDGSAGLAYWDDQQLTATVAQMDRLGWQVMLHATGDGAIGQAIAAYEHAARVNGVRSPGSRRHRIEHIDIPSAQDLQRCAQAGIVASSQPNFAYPDDTVLHNYSNLLGSERTARAQSYRAIDDAGVRQCFSSDYPVSSMDVLRAMHTAVARQLRGQEGTAPWAPQQRIGVEAALRHFTVDGAYAAFEEQRKGRLAPGLLADMAVLSEDILDDPTRHLNEAQVLMTVLGGRVVHQTTQAAAALRARAAAPMHMARGACPACRTATLNPAALAARAGPSASNRGAWRHSA
jgi:predicted amidohydrolase YtcJ